MGQMSFVFHLLLAMPMKRHIIIVSLISLDRQLLSFPRTPPSFIDEQSGRSDRLSTVIAPEVVGLGHTGERI